MLSDYQKQQQQLLSTLVKWTNIIIVVGVVLNCYWFFTDFWGTLLQNLGALALVGLGFWCLALARRDKMLLAARLYVASGMSLVALVILVLGPQSIVNGALTLAIFVLIGTFLESPDLALRWGLVAIILYVTAITVRIFGPVGDIGPNTVDVASVYAFPVLILMALALLGRSAARRLSAALNRSEVALSDLALGHRALQKAQADLSVAHEQVQVELAERVQAEEALRQSLEDTARDQRLLLALSQAAQSVQQARTPEEVYRTVGDEIRKLGYGAIVLRPGVDGPHLEVAYTSFDGSRLEDANELLGFPVLGYRIPQRPGSIVRRVLEEGRTILVDRYGDFVEAALPEAARPQVRELVAVLGMDQAITAPLAIEDENLGLLIVTGPSLTEDDRQAVSAFGSQAAIALTNVRLVQEIREWAEELEERVQERTADLAASEARYRRLFDSNRDALLVVDLQGHILDANPAASQLLGYDRDELPAVDLLAIDAEAVDASPDGRSRFLAVQLTAWREGLIYSERIAVTKQGDRIPVELNITPLTFQGREAMLVGVRDITERKLAEEVLRRSREQTIQNHQRLLALSQSAQAVQRARTTDDVYDVVGQEVKQLGFHAAVLRITADPSRLAVVYWTFDSALLRAAERLVGRSAGDLRIQLERDEALERVLDRGESVFFESTADRITRGIPSLGRIVIERAVQMLGIVKSIYSPLRIGGETQGLLMVAGADLNESDIPAVAILANQAGIAIENAQLLEEQRTSQARMQHLARQVVSAQEEERQRISRILHGESGQALTALRISLELIAQDLPRELDSTSQRILEAASLTDSTMERIRLMAQDLRPPALDTIGLGPTLEGFCQEFAGRTNMVINYHGSDVPPLPEPVNITMYRFLQEALTNVARHARADRVDVVLERGTEGLSLCVQDNGVGFDLDADGWLAERRSSMGLETMRERLESLGGTLEIKSWSGKGTRLNAYIPEREMHESQAPLRTPN